MRWGSLAIVALLFASAEARRGPKVVAIATMASPEHEQAAREGLAEATKDPTLAGADRVVGDDRSGYVAFTFDDGPNAQTTPVVIDALQKFDIPATFFLVTYHFTHPKHGAEAKALLAKELELGYTVGNHTAHHARLETTKDPQKLVTEVDEAFTRLSLEAQRPIGLFRAPYGKLSTTAKDHLHALGVTDVYWSIDSRDWETAEEDAAALRQDVFDQIVRDNGGVVLMHDTRKVTARIIHDVFDDLEAYNCKRLARRERPIWPVSLHYFLRDGGVPRAIPADVEQRTLAYQKAMPDRCADRAARTGRK